jgi:transposase
VPPTQLRNWVKAFADDLQHAFPGQGQMKPEQPETARLRREVIKLKAERDILEKAGINGKVRIHREAPGDLTGGLDMRGARCLAGWLLWLADTIAQQAQLRR